MSDRRMCEREPGKLTRRTLLLSAAALAAACTRGDSPLPAVSLAEQDPAYPRSELLAGPAWLRERLDDPALRLLDLSSLPDYRDGRISGARHVWWQDLIEVHNPVYGMLAGPDGRQAVVRDAGIGPDSTVVCYDRSGGVYASRMIWALRRMGFHRASLLDGGLQAWRASGGELSRRAASTDRGGGIEDIHDESINAHASDIVERRDEPGLVLLDTRTDGEREETWRGQLRSGQIPGSYWFPRGGFLVDGSVPAIVGPDVLRERLAGAGIDLDSTAEIIVYGLHATLASLPWLALTALAEPHVRLYEGSWAEWGARDELPVEVLPS